VQGEKNDNSPATKAVMMFALSIKPATAHLLGNDE
jgi:hypothetical protein